MGLLSWIVVGAIAGWLAGKLVKGEGFGCLGNIIVGVVGGLLGGFLASVLFNMPDAVNGFNLTSIVVAFLGAVIVVVVIRLLRGGRNYSDLEFLTDASGWQSDRCESQRDLTNIQKQVQHESKHTTQQSGSPFPVA